MPKDDDYIPTTKKKTTYDYTSEAARAKYWPKPASAPRQPTWLERMRERWLAWARGRNTVQYGSPRYGSPMVWNVKTGQITDNYYEPSTVSTQASKEREFYRNRARYGGERQAAIAAAAAKKKGKGGVLYGGQETGMTAAQLSAAFKKYYANQPYQALWRSRGFNRWVEPEVLPPPQGGGYGGGGGGGYGGGGNAYVPEAGYTGYGGPQGSTYRNYPQMVNIPRWMSTLVNWRIG